jgi:NitT/TauT family transport system ATP-binding protein
LIEEAFMVSELLRLVRVKKTYETDRKKVVGIDGISFSVQEGEFISIIGPSGCGKTTLLRCVAGFEKIVEGKIFISGKAVSKPGPDRFMIFQGLDQLFPWLTVRENIIFAMKAVNVNYNMDYFNEAEQYVDLVGLSGCGSLYPFQLSGGMKQRASIARALSVKPRLLLMDEPFGSLDTFSRKNIHQMLEKVWEKTKVSVIFVTHDMEEAVDLSSRILVLSDGRLVADATNPLPRPRQRETYTYRNFFLTINGLLEPGSLTSRGSSDICVPEVTLAF